MFNQFVDKIQLNASKRRRKLVSKRGKRDWSALRKQKTRQKKTPKARALIPGKDAIPLEIKLKSGAGDHDHQLFRIVEASDENMAWLEVSEGKFGIQDGKVHSMVKDVDGVWRKRVVENQNTKVGDTPFNPINYKRNSFGGGESIATFELAPGKYKLIMETNAKYSATDDGFPRPWPDQTNWNGDNITLKNKVGQIGKNILIEGSPDGTINNGDVAADIDYMEIEYKKETVLGGLPGEGKERKFVQKKVSFTLEESGDLRPVKIDINGIQPVPTPTGQSSKFPEEVGFKIKSKQSSSVLLNIESSAGKTNPTRTTKSLDIRMAEVLGEGQDRTWVIMLAPGDYELIGTDSWPDGWSGQTLNLSLDEKNDKSPLVSDFTVTGNDAAGNDADGEARKKTIEFTVPSAKTTETQEFIISWNRNKEKNGQDNTYNIGFIIAEMDSPGEVVYDMNFGGRKDDNKKDVKGEQHPLLEKTQNVANQQKIQLNVGKLYKIEGYTINGSGLEAQKNEKGWEGQSVSIMYANTGAYLVKNFGLAGTDAGDVNNKFLNFTPKKPAPDSPPLLLPETLTVDSEPNLRNIYLTWDSKFGESENSDYNKLPSGFMGKPRVEIRRGGLNAHGPPNGTIYKEDSTEPLPLRADFGTVYLNEDATKLINMAKLSLPSGNYTLNATWSGSLMSNTGWANQSISIQYSDGTYLVENFTLSKKKSMRQDNSVEFKVMTLMEAKAAEDAAKAAEEAAKAEAAKAAEEAAKAESAKAESATTAPASVVASMDGAHQHNTIPVYTAQQVKEINKSLRPGMLFYNTDEAAIQCVVHSAKSGKGDGKNSHPLQIHNLFKPIVPTFASGETVEGSFYDVNTHDPKSKSSRRK